MKLEVKLFAGVRDQAGAPVVQVETPDPPTVGRVREALVRRWPALGDLVSRSAFAVNARYADDDERIPEGADVACIPPVSGG